MGLYKKSEIGLVFILIIVIVFLFLGVFSNLDNSIFGSREAGCRSNRDCGSEAYCGSDFECHQYPTIQKTVVEYNFLGPSIIVGIAIIIAAIIFKYYQIKKSEAAKVVTEEAKSKKSESEEETEEVEEIVEPYYRSTGNIKTP